MALDTRYRPIKYADVLGQESSVDVLRQFVLDGRGFHQSYVFCGQHGSGKTTLGRILARALLCEAPVNGEPCDACTSCTSILERGTSECFVELDAATKSGKGDVTKITEEVTYSTFSGKRRIYLFDEAHQLSKQALDALLKPMEDTVPGTDDKLLVCIFCTTEPGKMRSTIFSRCAPAFVIRAVPPEGIAERLATVCEAEGIPYEKEALVTVAALTECHIRDALKTVEGVAMLGGVTKQTVSQYLRLDANETVLDLLLAVGRRDTSEGVRLADALSTALSPSTAYERLAEACMVVYRHRLGVAAPPPYWSGARVGAVADTLGDAVLHVASMFADPPRRPAPASLALDVAQACFVLSGKPIVHKAPVEVVQVSVPPPPAPPTPAVNTAVGMVSPPPPTPRAPPTMSAAPHETPNGVYIDPRAVRRSTSMEGAPPVRSPALSPSLFRDALATRLSELRDEARRAGRPNVGGS
jgi:DNA polymerase III subunit gamma/tau